MFAFVFKNGNVIFFCLLQVRQKSHHFAFGAAVNSAIFLANKRYRDFFLDNFEWAVLESSLKWNVAEKKEVRYDENVMCPNVYVIIR